MSPDERKKIILLIKLDAESLFKRIRNRQKEYIHTMALKRTREHFKDVFKTRYDDLKIQDLKDFSEEIILEVNEFYNSVDELRWYLQHTEDMPATIEDHTNIKIIALEKNLLKLQMYLEAELAASGLNLSKNEEELRV